MSKNGGITGLRYSLRDEVRLMGSALRVEYTHTHTRLETDAMFENGGDGYLQLYWGYR